MKTFSKSAMKAHALEIFRDIERTGEAVIITSHGKPVIKIVPYEQPADPAQVFAEQRKAYSCDIDLTAPTQDEWGEL